MQEVQNFCFESLHFDCVRRLGGTYSDPSEVHRLSDQLVILWYLLLRGKLHKPFTDLSSQPESTVSYDHFSGSVSFTGYCCCVSWLFSVYSSSLQTKIYIIFHFSWISIQIMLWFLAAQMHKFCTYSIKCISGIELDLCRQVVVFRDSQRDTSQINTPEKINKNVICGEIKILLKSK